MTLQDFLTISTFSIVQFFMLIGLLGLVFPIFPGLMVMWLAALGYGISSGFGTAGVIIFIVITLLALFGMVIDNILMGVGARQKGASWKVILAALAAGVLGTLVFPPFGGFIAAPLAVLGIQYYKQRDWRQAWDTMLGLATGWGLSFLARFAIGLAVMGLWWLWVWFNVP